MKMIDKLPGNRKEIFKKFNRFLKDKSIYKAYYRNLYNNRGGNNNSFCANYGGDMERFFSKCPANEWLTQCFIWVDQPEGETFWERYHRIWYNKSSY